MSDAKTLPRPEDVLDESRIQYQAMTALSDEEYRRLADDIRERGVLQPIITDEEGTILDGHHRAALAKHFDLDASREPAYVVIGDLNDDSDKLARAIKQNVIGRDTEKAVKSHSVKQYIETTWDRTDDGDLIRPETDSDVAEKLGVSQQLVSKVVNRTNSSIIDHERMRARRYKQDNPDASFREIARNVDAAKATVTRWIKEDFDEGDDEEDDDQPTLTATATDRDEAEKTADVFRRSQDDEDEEVREEAEENAERLARGDTSPDEAADAVEQTERELKEQQQKEQRETERERSFESADSVVETFHGDFRDVLAEYDGQIDHIVTDPPYDEDAVELWAALGEVAAEVLPEGGFVVAYSGKAHLPAIHDVLSDNLNYYWQGIVRHSGPGAKIFSRKLRTGYKPVLIYQKGELDAQEEFVSDVIEGTGREKDDHDWQQAEGEAAELLERFTAKDDTVCDPMCGSGTVGVACQRLKRRAVLIDKDPDAVATAREKVEK